MDNIEVDILSKKVKLQSNKKLLDAMLHINKDSKIKYNYLKLAVMHKVLELY